MHPLASTFWSNFQKNPIRRTSFYRSLYTEDSVNVCILIFDLADVCLTLYFHGSCTIVDKFLGDAFENSSMVALLLQLYCRIGQFGRVLIWKLLFGNKSPPVGFCCFHRAIMAVWYISEQVEVLLQWLKLTLPVFFFHLRDLYRENRAYSTIWGTLTIWWHSYITQSLYISLNLKHIILGYKREN